MCANYMVLSYNIPKYIVISKINVCSPDLLDTCEGVREVGRGGPLPHEAWTLMVLQHESTHLQQ